MAKADQHGPFKEFVFVDWMRDNFEGFWDKEWEAEFDLSDFRRHIRNARKEQLLAMRSLLDKAIERLEKAEEKVQT